MTEVVAALIWDENASELCKKVILEAEAIRNYYQKHIYVFDGFNMHPNLLRHTWTINRINILPILKNL